jgi:hypothetical protein
MELNNGINIVLNNLNNLRQVNFNSEAKNVCVIELQSEISAMFSEILKIMKKSSTLRLCKSSFYHSQTLISNRILC